MSDAKKREQFYPSVAFFVASCIMIIAAIIWGVNKRGFAVIFVISLLALLCLLAGVYLLHLYLQPSETDSHAESVKKPRIAKHSKFRQQIPFKGQPHSKTRAKPSHVELDDEEEDSLEDSVQSYLSHSHPTQSKRPYGVSARPIQRQAKVYADEESEIEIEPDWLNEKDTNWEEDSNREEPKQTQDTESYSSRPIISKPLRPRQQQPVHSQSGQLVRKTSSHSSHSESRSHPQLIRKNSSQIL